MKKAMKYYEEAIQRAENNLGEHENTSACYKILGDLLLLDRKNEKAMEYYDKARRMREELKLDASEEYVLLLNNIGRCLMFVKGHVNEATATLEKARDLAEKLAEDDGPTSCKGKVYASLSKNYKYLRNLEKAKEFADKALKVNKESKDKFLSKKEIHTLEKNCKTLRLHVQETTGSTKTV